MLLLRDILVPLLSSLRIVVPWTELLCAGGVGWGSTDRLLCGQSSERKDIQGAGWPSGHIHPILNAMWLDDLCSAISGMDPDCYDLLKVNSRAM